MTTPYDRLQNLNEAVCIIATKVFSSCKDKECLFNIHTPELQGTAPYVLTYIKFGKAVISDTIITSINDGKNLSRAEFNLTVPYTIKYTANDVEETLTDTLLLSHKDILIYIPITKNNNSPDYRLIAETYTKILDEPSILNNTFVFSVGFYEIFKVIEDVQLYIPSFGYCPLPQDYKPYIPANTVNMCDTFMTSKFFPKTFFPKDLPRDYHREIPILPYYPKKQVIVTFSGYIDSYSKYAITFTIVITRHDKGNKDYYYSGDILDNSNGPTPLWVDKTYTINIDPPIELGDTEQVNTLGWYI